MRGLFCEVLLKIPINQIIKRQANIPKIRPSKSLNANFSGSEVNNS